MDHDDDDDDDDDNDDWEVMETFHGHPSRIGSRKSIFRYEDDADDDSV